MEEGEDKKGQKGEKGQRGEEGSPGPPGGEGPEEAQPGTRGPPGKAGQDGKPEMDIDDILEELLSQFKEMHIDESLGEKEVPRDEMDKLLTQFKAQTNDSDSDLKVKRKTQRSLGFESKTEDSDDEKRPKRRGRPRKDMVQKDMAEGFTDPKIRRLGCIAQDAELVDKSAADLKRLGDLLHNSCISAMQEYEEPLKENPTEGKEPGKRRGPPIKISGVQVNVKAIIQPEEALAILHQTIPADPEERKKFCLSCRAKAAHFDVDWGVEDDTRLLLGVYKHGDRNWELAKSDPELKLTDKILPVEPDKKPQGKQLQARVHYLLKLLKKDLEKKDGLKEAVEKEQKKKEETTGGKKVFQQEAAAGSGRNFMMSQIPHSPHPQKLQPRPPHHGQMHGHQRDNYSPPNKRHFNNPDQGKGLRDLKFNDSGNVNQMWGGEWHHPYEQHRYKEHPYADWQPRGEPHRSSGNDQMNHLSRKRPHEPYNSDRDYRGHRDYDKRLGCIAQDAELVDKSAADLKRLGDLLHNSCISAMQEYEEPLKENPTEGKEPGKRRGPPIKISGVQVNVKAIIQPEEALAILHQTIPADPEERKKFCLSCLAKAAHFDVDGGVEVDPRLLLGVYEHGDRNWELALTELKLTELKLTDKILPVEPDKKPQGKQLQARVDYSLKLLKKDLEKKDGLKEAVEKEQKKKEETTGGKKVFQQEAAAGSGRNFMMSQIPHSPHPQKLQPRPPHHGQMHGHQRDNYSPPNKRHFNNPDQGKGLRDLKFNDSGNVNQMWGGEWHHQYEQHRYKEHPYADWQPRGEPHRSSGNYQMNHLSRKRPHEPYNSDRDYRGHRDYDKRHPHDSKRWRSDEFWTPNYYLQDFQRMSYHRPPMGYRSQGPSDHLNKSDDYKQPVPLPHSYVSDPLSPPSQTCNFGVMIQGAVGGSVAL